MDEDSMIYPDGSVRKKSTGHFAKGHRSPGRGHVSALRQAFCDAVTVEDIQQITRKLVSLGKEGDKEAVKLLFDGLWGRLPNKLKLVEDRTVNVNIRNLTEAELKELERLALRVSVPPTLEAQAVVKGDDE